MDLEMRVAALERKMAELGKQDPVDPKMEQLKTKITNFQEIAKVVLPEKDLGLIPGERKPNLVKPWDQNQG